MVIRETFTERVNLNRDVKETRGQTRGEWSEDPNSSPGSPPFYEVQHFASYLNFLALVLLLCQLGVQIPHTLEDQI